MHILTSILNFDIRLCDTVPSILNAHTRTHTHTHALSEAHKRANTHEYKKAYVVIKKT